MEDIKIDSECRDDVPVVMRGVKAVLLDEKAWAQVCAQTFEDSPSRRVISLTGYMPVS